jgi:hypothetical protein
MFKSDVFTKCRYLDIFWRYSDFNSKLLSFNPCILGEQGNKWFTRLSTGGVISLVPVKISPNKFLVKKCVNLI